MSSLFESCTAGDTLQQGGGVAELATALAPVLEQFREGLFSIGSSVLKKLKNQVGRGMPKKKPTAKKRGKKSGVKIQIGKGKVSKGQKGKKTVQKGKGAPAKKSSPKKSSPKKKKKANF
jgi:hypothetical protein